MSGEAMRSIHVCQGADKCRWEMVQVRDMYGIRTEFQRCTVCGQDRIRSSHSPTLGDRHYRED